MALCSADCEEMLRVAKETGKKLMVGQCLRFDTAYLYLKECIDDGRFGALRRLVMDRLSSLPRWGFDGWFRDVKRSGGVPLDLHSHDIDMARFLLGEPTAVSSVACDDSMPMQYVDTRLFYEDATVFAHASWDESATVKFSASYRARFENATVICTGKEIWVYPDEGEFYQVEITFKNHMAEEIRTMAYWVGDPAFENTSNTPDSACQSVKLVEAIVNSIQNGGAVICIK
jgi:predicted dehydrogenase